MGKLVSLAYFLFCGIPCWCTMRHQSHLLSCLGPAPSGGHRTFLSISWGFCCSCLRVLHRHCPLCFWKCPAVRDGRVSLRSVSRTSGREVWRHINALCDHKCGRVTRWDLLPEMVACLATRSHWPSTESLWLGLRVAHWCRQDGGGALQRTFWKWPVAQG